MGFFSRNNSYNQTINGDDNFQYMDNSVHIGIGGSNLPPHCRTQGVPSLGGCEGTNCPHMWSCEIYSRYLDRLIN
jgi:hypothetical protein